jgi:ABC-type multidrug transport system ATPase subunit
MKIILSNTGKRFNQDWIFRKISLTLETGNNYVILGANGSGKSTLLQTIAGFIAPSEGKVEYFLDNNPVTVENIFRHLSIASPYIELIEDMTFLELIHYQSRFKDFVVSDVAAVAQLEKVKNKQIKLYSSGMKQRAKLALAILSKTSLLLLDEPISNLDKNGVEWYKEMMAVYASEKLAVVCSNSQAEEYGFCNQNLVLEHYKT